jgi:hypothetical protein
MAVDFGDYRVAHSPSRREGISEREESESERIGDSGRMDRSGLIGKAKQFFLR